MPLLHLMHSLKKSKAKQNKTNKQTNKKMSFSDIPSVTRLLMFSLLSVLSSFSSYAYVFLLQQSFPSWTSMRNITNLHLQDNLFHPSSLNLVNALFHFSPLCSVGDLPSFIRIPSHIQRSLSLPRLTGCVFSHVRLLSHDDVRGGGWFFNPLPRISTVRVPLIPFFSILSCILLLFNASVSTASFAFILQNGCVPRILKKLAKLP